MPSYPDATADNERPVFSLLEPPQASTRVATEDLAMIAQPHIDFTTPASLQTVPAHASISEENVEGHNGEDNVRKDGNHAEFEQHHKLEDAGLTDQTNLLPFRQVMLIFTGLIVCALCSTLDQTIVATALPSISAHFNAGSVASFIPTTYLLTNTAFQPLYGRFSDIFGRKVTLCLAMATFMFGNIAAGFSNRIIEIIIFRGVAGAGGGGINSVAQIIVSDVVSLRDRGKYIGLVGVVIAVGNGLGPLIGGVISEKITWRWCFWITMPLALAGTLNVIFFLPLKSVEGDMKKKLVKVDYIGLVLTVGGCTLIMLPLIWGGITFPWRSAVILATLISGFVAVSLFCLWEWKVAKLPTVPRSGILVYIFKHMTVSGVYITMFVNGFTFNSSLYYLPQFFQVGLGFSPTRSGTFLLPILVSQTFASGLSGFAVSRMGKYRSLIFAGFSIWAIGCGMLSTINETTKKALLVFYMLLSGIGTGLTMQTSMVAAQASVSRKDMSVVTAVRNFMRQLGGTFSLAIGSTIINNALRSRMTALHLPRTMINGIVDDPTVLSSLLTSNSSNQFANQINPATAHTILRGYDSGFHNVFILNASLSALCVIVAYVMIKHKELVRADEAEMKRRAKEEYERKRREKKGVKGGKETEDIEMGVMHTPGDVKSAESAAVVSSAANH